MTRTISKGFKYARIGVLQRVQFCVETLFHACERPTSEFDAEPDGLFFSASSR